MRSAAGRARLLTQRLLALIALLAGGALLFSLLAGRDDDIGRTEATPDERGYYLTDATLTELGPDGAARVVVRARSIEQQPSDESVLMQHLEMDYTTVRAGAWHVTADQGSMPRERTLLELSGNVRVSGSPERAGGRALILTDMLAYDTRSNVILTSSAVDVQFGAHHINGRGLRVALNDGTLRLESNVNGSFTP
ncbi:MAG: LPS export ABC transporter periplasmic protein LptC [Steroidobacteraceae bacterium]